MKNGVWKERNPNTISIDLFDVLKRNTGKDSFSRSPDIHFEHL
jgi:hypothetical protein